MVHLQERLNAFPRVALSSYPTPLEHLPRLSAEMGREVFVKRDDVLGPGLGGNKTRKLEYLMAEAQAKRSKKVVTFGGLQSNHARLTAAAARKLGMEPHLFYFEPRPKLLDGNLHVNHLLGAKLHFIPLGGGGAGMTIEQTIRLVRVIAFCLVGPNYFIPVGGHTALACLGYAQCAAELHRQAQDAGIQDATVVLAAGSGGTLSGLMAGLKLLDSPLQLLGIDVGKMWKAFPASIALLASETAALLGKPQRFTSTDVPMIEGRYVGECYGKPSAECLSAAQRLACREGILLDPVYTAKAFAGMLAEANHGRLQGDSPLIFLHTGGLPAIFADL